MLARDAFGVNAQKNLYAMASPFGNLCCRYPGIEPRGNARVAEIIRTLGQDRGSLSGCDADPGVARTEFERSAAEVVEVLCEIEAALFSQT